MRAVGEVIAFVLWVGVLVLIARFVIDWVQVLARSWRPRGVVLVLCEAVYTVTDPPLRALRRVIPPLRLGAVALDLSPMVLLIALYLLQILNGAVFLV
ncbi:MAG: YggT family protein [Nocardioidaceae bacterium]|nr:YggT family protein [Nocardioidaceae bacterium]